MIIRGLTQPPIMSFSGFVPRRKIGLEVEHLADRCRGGQAPDQVKQVLTKLFVLSTCHSKVLRFRFLVDPDPDSEMYINYRIF